MKKLYLFCLVYFVIPNFDSFAEKVSCQSKNNLVYFLPNLGQLHDGYFQPRPDLLFLGITPTNQLQVSTNGYAHQLATINRQFKGNTQQISDYNNLQMKFARVDVNWVGSNREAVLQAENPRLFYRNYFNLPFKPEGVCNVPEFGSMRLNNIYHGIDIRFYQVGDAIEYDYILSAEADFRDIKLTFLGSEPYLNDNGDLVLSTPLGEIVEEAPVVIQNGLLLTSSWQNNMDGTWGFSIENARNGIALVIDPIIRTWGTFYGGNSFDEGFGTTTSKIGERVFLTGQTLSSNQIATSNAYQSVISGNVDAYLTTFNQDGSLIWSTYFGGILWDQGIAIGSDYDGNIVLVGNTMSASNIATNGSYQTQHFGNWDGFIVKFNALGSRLWSSYYGGGGWDKINDVTIDQNNTIIICGETLSNNQIATAGSHQANSAGAFDGFIAKFSSSGTRMWGTYYGGIGEDYITSCRVDPNNRVVFGGYTTSNSQIATSGTHQPQISTSISNPFISTDAFLVRLSANGVRQWGTYFGGPELDRGWGVTTDSSSNVFLVGETQSNSNISNAIGFQQNYSGNGDGFAAKFGNSGSLIQATYVGGSSSDTVLSCSVDGSGSLFIAGKTRSANQIASAGAFQNNIQGLADGFVMKLSAQGQFEDGTYYGSTGFELINSLSIGAGNSVFVSGTTPSTTRISSSNGHQRQYGGGQTDAFLARLDNTISTNFISDKLDLKSVQILGNPFENQTQVALSEIFELVESIYIYDFRGKLIKSLVPDSKIVTFGSDLAVGGYILNINLKTRPSINIKILKIR